MKLKKSMKSGGTLKTVLTCGKTLKCISDFMKIKLETSLHNYDSDLAYVVDIKNWLNIDLD